MIKPTVASASAALRDAEAEHAATEALVASKREELAARKAKTEEASNSLVLSRSQLSALQTQKRHCQLQLGRWSDGLAAREHRLALSRDTLLETSQKMEALRLRGCAASEQLFLRSSELGQLADRLAERRQQLRSLRSQTVMLRLQLGQGRWPPKEKRERAFALWRSRLAQIERTRENLRRAALRFRGATLLGGLRRWMSACSRAQQRKMATRQTHALAELQQVNEQRLQLQIDAHAAGVSKPRSPSVL